MGLAICQVRRLEGAARCGAVAEPWDYMGHTSIVGRWRLAGSVRRNGGFAEDLCPSVPLVLGHGVPLGLDQLRAFDSSLHNPLPRSPARFSHLEA